MAGSIGAMNDRSLRYFLAVVRSGSVRRAAEALHVAPSAISRQVADLEVECRQPLLERRARGMVPTEAGWLVAEHAQRQVENLDLLQDRLQRMLGVKDGTVRIRCGSTWLPDLLENGILPFGAQHPDLKWQVGLGTTATIQAAVASGDADIGILYNPTQHEGLVSRAVATRGVQALVSAAHPLAADLAPRYLRALCGVPVAVLPESHGLRQLLGRIEADEDFRLMIRLETEAVDLQRQFALSGAGIAISSGLLISQEGQGPRLVAIPLLDPVLAAGKVHLIVRAERRLPEAVERTAEYLRVRMLAFQTAFCPA